MSDLKPCPFCGGEAEVRMRHDSVFGVDWYRAQCVNEHLGSEKTSKDKAITAWNTRTDPWNTDMEAACHKDEDIVVKYDDGTVLVFQKQYGGFNKAVYRAPSIPQPTKWMHLPPEGDE